MPRRLLLIQLSLLLFFLSGCATKKKYIGKSLPPDYYVCSTRSFPAKCYQGSEYFRVDYELTKLEGSVYLLTGTVEELGGAFRGARGSVRVDLVFILIKDNIVVDAIETSTVGAVTSMRFKKRFISEVDFDGITITYAYGTGTG